MELYVRFLHMPYWCAHGQGYLVNEGMCFVFRGVITPYKALNWFRLCGYWNNSVTLKKQAVCCAETSEKIMVPHSVSGTRWRSWLRHSATSRKVAGSIPDGVTGIFHWHNPSGRSMAWGRLSLWQKWVTGIFPGGKGGWCVELTVPVSCGDCQPPGNFWGCGRPVQGYPRRLLCVWCTYWAKEKINQILLQNC